MLNPNVVHPAASLLRTETEFSAPGRRVPAAESDCAEVIAELHGLLEAYAPVWYTERLHLRVENALRTTGRM